MINDLMASRMRWKLHVRFRAGENLEIIYQRVTYCYADILISKKIPLNTVYVLADPEFVGVMPIRQDINVIPADRPEDLRLGWVVYEEIGCAVVNSMAVAKITVQ